MVSLHHRHDHVSALIRALGRSREQLVTNMSTQLLTVAVWRLLGQYGTWQLGQVKLRPT